MSCPRSSGCVFHQTVGTSVVKRVRYASVFSYCRGGEHEKCALYRSMADGSDIRHNLMPDGTVGDYRDERSLGHGRRFLIIEDSPVFAALASSTINSNFNGAQVVRAASFETALAELAGDWAAIVCGFGIGGGKTAHDVRRHTEAPMVILTGRPDHIELPRGATRVNKGDGPEALAKALRACLS